MDNPKTENSTENGNENGTDNSNENGNGIETPFLAAIRQAARKYQDEAATKSGNPTADILQGTTTFYDINDLIRIQNRVVTIKNDLDNLEYSVDETVNQLRNASRLPASQVPPDLAAQATESANLQKTLGNLLKTACTDVQDVCTGIITRCQESQVRYVGFLDDVEACLDLQQELRDENEITEEMLEKVRGLLLKRRRVIMSMLDWIHQKDLLVRIAAGGAQALLQRLDGEFARVDKMEGDVRAMK